MERLLGDTKVKHFHLSLWMGTGLFWSFQGTKKEIQIAYDSSSTLPEFFILVSSIKGCTVFPHMWGC